MTINALVERERQHLRMREVAAAVLLGAGVVALLLAGGALALGHARWLVLPRGLPLALWLGIAITVIALALRTQRRLRGRGTRRDVALAIEQEQGMRRGALVGVLELEGSSALARRAAEHATRTLPMNAPLAPAMRRASAMRAARGAAAAIAGALVLGTATPLFGDGLRAVLSPIDAWNGTLLARPRIVGAPRELLRGSPLAVTLDAPGRRVLYLEVRQTGEAARRDTIALDANGHAKWSTPTLRGDLRMIASDGRASSDSVLVRAADRPFVGAVALRAHFPAYLGRADEQLAAGEPLRIPQGTRLEVSGRSSVPLADVALVSQTGARTPLATTGQSFVGELALASSARLAWNARAQGGIVPDLPEPLDITIVPDSAPHVVINEPTVDTILVSTEPVTLGVQVTDDHGTAEIALRVHRTSGAAADVTQLLARDAGTSWAGNAALDVSALHLSAGDVALVRAEAVDASPWAQRGASREIVLRRATSEEQRSRARALADSAVRQAQSAANDQKSLAQRTDEASRAQSRQSSSDASSKSGSSQQQQGAMKFENAEKARALAQEQRAMTDRVEKLKQATQALEQQLKAAGALDTALARQLGEAQALMRQALTPQLLAQMQKLESAARNMNGEQSRDALRDLAQMQQKMREQLEKSAEMLKRAAHEGAMQTLGDEAKELAQKERALADSSGARGEQKGDKQGGAGEQKAGDSQKPGSARQAQQLADRAQRLREDMAQLKERLEKDRAQAGASQTEQAAQHAAGSESAMRRSASAQKSESGEQGGEKGANAAREAAGEMDRAAKSMQDARSQQVKEWKQELTQELDRSVQEMMQLAQQERALEQQARASQQGDDRRGAQSAVEQGVDKASERLQGEGKKSALLSQRSQRAMAEAKAKVSEATQSIAQQPGGASKQAGALSEAADALTRAAASLARDREKANNANSASGFSELLQQMQEAAQKQGEINGQSQNLMNMPNAQGTQAGQQLARMLARQQRQVAEQLEDAGDATGGDRAAQLAREARQVADALDGGRLDNGTIARQQQLFRRLLDAGKSLEKEDRDDTGKREAKSASGDATFTPPGAVNAKAAVKFRPPTWQELRGLSAEERRAILDYFGRLNGVAAP